MGYVVNQKLSETTAEYCREDTPGTSGGTSLDFLTSVGSKLTHINEEMAYLPRCLTIEIGSGSDLAGSYVISLRGGRRFAFSKVEGNHYCVYNTEKPWCADEYAPLNYFRKHLMTVQDAVTTTIIPQVGASVVVVFWKWPLKMKTRPSSNVPKTA